MVQNKESRGVNQDPVELSASVCLVSLKTFPEAPSTSPAPAFLPCGGQGSSVMVLISVGGCNSIHVTV